MYEVNPRPVGNGGHGSGRPHKPTLYAPKPRETGHETVLRAIQKDGRAIHIQLLDDATVLSGKLIARDKFTLSVECTNGVVMVLFKHAIRCFWADPKTND
jgi:sRNA-binding regulator protein Hfq